MAIFVTGAAGYIGSHTCVQLLQEGYEVVAADNFSNSEKEVLGRIADISGKTFPFYPYDLTNDAHVDEIFASAKIDAVIHFAAHKSCAESIREPLKYYWNNLSATMNVLKAMKRYDVKAFVFSSSACVYGETTTPPFTEEDPVGAVNPYGQDKSMAEQMLQDICFADSQWSAVALRYFNPIGAHESGLIGEKLSGEPENLMPRILRVALGMDRGISIYGSDYPTDDGTAVRDYLHVMDLAQGHLAALRGALHGKGMRRYNMGTGRGTGVLELIHAFEAATGIVIPHEFQERRAGDIAISYADASKAEKELEWVAKRTVQDMCRDAWAYAKRYETNCNGHQ